MYFTLHYNARAVAVVADGRVHFLPALTVYEEDHPLRRFVAAMTLYLLDIDEGLLPAPPDLELARLYARAALIDEDAFRRVADDSDVALAERFNVPLDQIAERRIDLVLDVVGPKG